MTVFGDKQLALAGRWRKDVKACTGLEDAADAIKLPWLFRKLMKSKSEMRIAITPEHFQGQIVALRGMLKGPAEVYPWDGQWRTYVRRDGRKGSIQARCSPIENGVRIESKWEGLFSGTEIEENHVEETPKGNRFISNHWLTIGDKPAVQYTTVYRRVC